MSIIVKDTMAGTSGAVLTSRNGETGATWTSVSSFNPARITDSGRVRGGVQTNGGFEYYPSGVPSGAEYTLWADLYIASIPAYIVRNAILGRYATSGGDNYSFGHFRSADGSTSRWELRKILSGGGGSSTLLGSSDQTLVVGTTYRLKLEVTNATKKCFVDGVEIISSPDNGITSAGRGAIYLWASSDSSNTIGGHLDNFAVTNVGDADPFIVVSKRTVGAVVWI